VPKPAITELLEDNICTKNITDFIWF